MDDKILNFWRRRQRAMALLAGVVCVVSIVEKEPSAELALRPQQGQGVREARGAAQRAPARGMLGIRGILSHRAVRLENEAFSGFPQ